MAAFVEGVAIRLGIVCRGEVHELEGTASASRAAPRAWTTTAFSRSTAQGYNLHVNGCGTCITVFQCAEKVGQGSISLVGARCRSEVKIPRRCAVSCENRSPLIVQQTPSNMSNFDASFAWLIK